MADERSGTKALNALAGGAAPASVVVFGDFALTAPDGSAIVLANRHARALLAMLCIAPDSWITRDTLTRLLWPGRFEAQARASLRQCLLELGKTLETNGCPILSVSRERIGLVAGHVQTDLGDLEQALAVGDVEQVSTMLHAIGANALLDQMHVSDGFGEWLSARRNEIERRIGSSIADAIDRVHRAGNAATAARLHDAWAIRDKASLRQTLPTPLPTPADGRSRIAVLPFRAYAGGDGADYFVEGMAEELISTLGQVPQLMVTGRTSSFHFRDSPLGLPEIARALQVSHLIEGAVQRQGDAVRVHVHLLDGASGFELWASRFDGSLDDVFALQENVAQAVTAAIGNALGVAIQPPLVPGLTTSKAAYDLYLQGRALNARLFGDGVLTRAAALVEDAVALDPNFAEAWVLLGDIRQRMGIYLVDTDLTEASAVMADCVRKAIAIKPDLGMA